MRRVVSVAVAMCVSVVVAGCGLGSPKARTGSPISSTAESLSQSSSQSVSARVAAAERTHEYPASPAPQHVAAGWGDPVTAVVQFTTEYINWTPATIAVHLRALARVSVGQARSELAMAAFGAARDGELRRGGVSNAGVVESVGRVRGTRHEYAVATQERTTSTVKSAYQGLPTAWHLTLATVARVHGLWVISNWQPEN